MDETDSVLQQCNFGGTPRDLTFTVPSRWRSRPATYEEAVEEVDRLAQILVRGANALCGLYLRICDTLRAHTFSDAEMRGILAKHFPPQRVSEFIRIVNSPDETYRRYRAGFIGFRAALEECRGYRINSSEHLKSKKIRRAAERLINLLGHGEISVKGKRVVIQPITC